MLVSKLKCLEEYYKSQMDRNTMSFQCRTAINQHSEDTTEDTYTAHDIIFNPWQAHTCKKIKVRVQLLEKTECHQMDGRWTGTTDCITFPTNAVSNQANRSTFFSRVTSGWPAS